MANEHNMADGNQIIPVGMDMNGNDIAINMLLNLDENVPPEELRARRLAMLLDAPHEPPLNFNAVPDPPPDPLRPRKKRSLYTMTMPLMGGRTEVSQLLADGMRAMREARPKNPTDFFANYLNEHMNSQNYPNGQGLPQHWGQL